MLEDTKPKIFVCFSCLSLSTSLGN